MQIDLNADLGEGFPDDDALLRIVTSANVACGWHAGDAATMETTILKALEYGVVVGAHPSYPDREGFGRRPMERDPAQVYADVLAQLSELGTIATRCRARIAHVKAHGALYNRAATDRSIADAISRAASAFDPQLAVVGLAGGEQIASARAFGLRAVKEVFADRGYAADGTLLPRGTDGASIDDPARAAAAAVSFAKHGAGETICVHGDGPLPVVMARAIRRALDEAGVEVRCVDSR